MPNNSTTVPMKYLKLPFTFDVERLQAEANTLKHEELRMSESRYVVPETYYLAELIHPIPNEFHEDGHPKFGPNETLKKLPYIQEIEASFQCIKESFRLTKLLPGAEIGPHRDFLMNYENGHLRVHIPVITPQGSTMTFEDETFVMHEGECWYADYGSLHQTVNPYDIDRWHLVMDCRANDWWHDIMKKAGYEPTSSENQ